MYIYWLGGEGRGDIVLGFQGRRQQNIGSEKEEGGGGKAN